MRRLFQLAAATLAAAALAFAAPPRIGASDGLKVPVGDITSIAGVRDNMLVGLAGTGDRRQTLFTTQTLGNILQKMGVTIAPTQVTVLNVAAVFVTAT